MSNALILKCEKHGTGKLAVVCRHLAQNRDKPLGFIENSSEPGDYQGWCYACEYVYLQEGEMTEKFKAFSDTAIVCEGCYHDIKAHHDVDA